jgi:hypothetical protein
MGSSEGPTTHDTPPRSRGHRGLRAVFLIAVGFLTLLLWTGLFTFVHRQVRSQQLGTSWREVVMVLWPLLPFAVPAVIAWRFKSLPVWLMNGVIVLTVALWAALFLIA